MEPATTAMLIKLGGELGAVLIKTLRAAGRPDVAEEIRVILSRSDANFQSVADWAERD